MQLFAACIVHTGIATCAGAHRGLEYWAISLSLWALDATVTQTLPIKNVVNCKFHKFTVAPLGAVHFPFPNQQFLIQCLIMLH